MGCDYITWIETVIVYKDVSGDTLEHIEQSDYERHWEHTLAGVVEEQVDLLNLEIIDYGTEYLYSNDKWRCNDAGKPAFFS